MPPIIPARPQNPHRTSSSTSQSSSFRSLFTQPSSKPKEPSIPRVEDNRILPVKDFPPQAERRRSSQPELDLNSNEVPVSQDGLTAANNDTIKNTPVPSRSTSLNHQRSHSLRRKPVPPLLFNPDAIEKEQSLPSDHPFAVTHLRTRSQPDSGSNSIKSVSTGRATPVPSVSDRPNGTPPPPGRKPGLSPSASSSHRSPPPPRAKASSPLPPKDENDVFIVKKSRNIRPDTAGTFGGRSSLDGSRPPTAVEGHKGQLRRLDKEDKEDALHARMISLSLDRPLPPTPSGSQDPMPQASSPASGRTGPRTIRGSTDSNATTSRSLDLFDMLRAGPSRQSRSTSVATSVPMSKTGGSSGSKFKSNVFRWDSTEKVTKSTSGEGKKRTATEEEEFSVDRIPSKKNLWEAGTCFLKDENGDLKCFGDFFPKYPNDPASLHDDQDGKGKGKDTNSPKTSPMMEKSATYSGTGSIHGDIVPKVYKTVVFFIRHFWCGQCQDYTFASLSLLDPVALEKAGIRVVIISNGSWKIIKAYKKLFNCPFPIYVDGPRRLYQLMGMTKMTNDFGPMFKGRAAYHQRAVPGQLLHGLGNAFFRMPLANPGTLTQLGGEFVFTPGWNCEFAHRMTTTSDHMEAPDVLRAAGCAYPTKSDAVQLELAESQRAELEKLEKEMKEWQDNRVAELERIRQKKAARRGVVYMPSARRESELTLGLGGGEIGSEGTFEQEINQALDARSHTPLELKSALSGEESPSEIDAKLLEVLQEREIREREKLAAGELMLARGKGDLEVQLVQGQA
ncbi:uncharacterized protein I303_100409 [Kwoniella dejecticola CBS 10117]|uniref:Thioredoxin domain-containing protein n=1 Tax=Kwoniella dejecticola CBS 10117 TaxID=1296121 RepID=A0A1A6AEV5_9TREE|nr:uncharacterized protein I303_00408 [Kwoniella dejecticola CBS 10117]OBR88591.1 hypothetical protein I303_00408 [Kwoniella dejecticola CBS 10117]